MDTGLTKFSLERVYHNLVRDARIRKEITSESKPQRKLLMNRGRKLGGEEKRVCLDLINRLEKGTAKFKWVKRQLASYRITAQGLFKEGITFEKKNNIEDALRCFEAAKALGSNKAQETLRAYADYYFEVAKQNQLTSPLEDTCLFYEFAEKHGCKEASVPLTALYYQMGLYYEKLDDDDKAYEVYELAAHRGYVLAALKVGIMADRHEKNYAKAFYWLREVAENYSAGFAQCIAQRSIGRLFFEGKIADTQNFENAVMWCMRAALKKDVESYMILGYIAWEQKSYYSAQYWLKKAHEEGNHPQAQFALGGLAELGLVSSVDKQSQYTEAAQWYRKAISQGHQDAKKALVRLYAEDLLTGKEKEKVLSKQFEETL